MTITHHIKIDMVKKLVPPRVHAMQYDTNTRIVEVELMANGEQWVPPEGVSFALTYRKPDGKRGFYNQLSEDVSAISVEENKVSLILAHQVLTTPGMVDAALVMNDAEMNRLASFPFEIHVDADPSAGTTQSDDYFNCGVIPKYAVLYAPQDLSPEEQAQARSNIKAVATVNGSEPDENGNVQLPGGGGNADLTGYATEQWVQEGYQPKGEYLTQVPEGYAKSEDIPTKPEDIGAQPAGNYALKNEIPSAHVQSVNGKTGSVQLSASDVKARPDNWMPTAQEVGALPSTYTPPNQTAAQVGADPKGTAASAVSQHNTEADSHNDIRLELKAINDRLTAFFDSDNQTLDELSEIVAYITSNKTLIDSITTSKVSVADIINNLTTNVANKPLSAAQGVALKALIDAITVPTKVSQLQNDAGYLTQHQDISGKLDASKLPEAINTALAQAQNSGVFDGKDGRGIKSIVRTSGTGAAGTTDTYTVTYTDNTTSTISVYNGKDGTNGTSVTVSSVTESTEDGGTNIVKFSDGKTILIKNGKTGAPGKNPVRGTDYWTPADQDAIVQQVVDALGGTLFGTVDANNNITLIGGLADGTYTIKYEDADGTVTEIGTIEVGEKLPTSGYAEMTWQEGVKLDKNNGTEGTGSGYAASGHVELWDGYTYTVKQTMCEGKRYGGMNVLYYDANGGFVSCVELWSSNSDEHSVVLNPPANAATFRLRVYYSTFLAGMWPVYFEKTA